MMRNRFDMQLQKLNDELINMGNLIEDAIEMAVTALVQKDIKLAKEAIKFDEEIDQQEKDIENMCLKLLLQQQPVARDLRLISSALKMITDMERIGDHASDISEITILLSDYSYVNELDNIQKMSKETIDMVKKSLEAFVNRDIKLARKVIQKDDIVDELFLNTKKAIIKMINENRENGEQAADFLMIAKYFERIGDHATNIAEWVEFSITGNHVDDLEKIK